MTVTFRRYIGLDIPMSIVPVGTDDAETFGERLYLLAQGAFLLRLKVERDCGDPVTAGNLGAILAICAEFVPMIDAHEAANAGRVDGDGLSWGFLARCRFAELVVQLVRCSAERMADQMPAGSNLTIPSEDEIAELVEAVLFPDVETCRRSEERKGELLEVFDAMRSTLRELNGWDPDL